MKHYRFWFWLIVRGPVLGLIVVASILIVLSMFNALGVEFVYLPQPLAALWEAYHNSEGGPSNAALTGIFSVWLLWLVSVNMKDDRSVRQRQIEKKLGKAAGRAVFAALTTSYVAVILVGASAWGSFALAGKLLAEAYPYKATSPILPMVVYSWLQGFPGAVLYALQVACLFAFKSKKEKQKAREDLREQVQEEPRLFGGFGPQIRLSREFYLGSRIQRIVIISLVLFGVSGVPLMAGFGASSTAQIWEIWVVIADGILAAVLVGVFGGWLASRMISRVSLGPETSDDDRAGRNRAALAYMLGSIPGSIFSSVAGICPILLGSASGNADQGSYAFWSHLGGALCGMLAVYSHERIVSRKV